MKLHKSPTFSYIEKAKNKTARGISRFERAGRLIDAAIKLHRIKNGESFLQINKKINNNEVSDFVRACN